MAGGSGADQWRDRLPQGSVRDVLRRAVGSDELQSRGLHRLRHGHHSQGPGGSISVVGGEDLVIPKDAHNMADTIKFVRFLQQPLAQLAMASAGDMTAYKTNNANERKINPALRGLRAAVVDRAGSSGHPGLRALDTAFSNELAEMLAGKVTVAAGLAAATTAANAALK